MAERLAFDVVFNSSPVLVANAFFASAQRAEDLLPPMERVAELASLEMEANFAAQGRPNRWQALADATVRRRGEGAAILDESGELRDAASDPGNWSVTRQGQSVVASQENIPEYGELHLTGTQFMPIRDWSYLSPQFDEEADSALLDWITEPLG